MRRSVAGLRVSGRWRSSASSRWSSPRSTSCITATAVNVFVIEPIRYCVSGVAARPPSASARPTAPAHTGSPRWTTAALTLGSRSACASRSSRSRSGSSVLTQKAPRDGLDRALDVVVVDVEVEDGPQDAWIRRVGEPDPGLRERLDRVVAREPEGTEVEPDEVRLGAGVEPRRGPRIGEPRGARVVVGEPLDVVLERVQPGRGDDAT